MFSTISKLTIKLSTYCNLTCEYCHQLSDDKRQDVRFDKWKELYDFLLKLPLADFVEVTLTGGEVSTLKDEYLMAVRWLSKIERQREVQFTYAVVSNGTNMDMLFEMMNRKTLNPKRTTISWDGIKSATTSRKPRNQTLNDDYFNRCIQQIGKSKYNQSISISHAITPTNIEFLHESLLYALKCGIRNFGFYYIHEADYSSQVFVSEFKKQIEMVAQEFVRRYDKIESRFVYYNWQLLYSKIGLKNTPENMIATTTCQKLGNTLHIDPYGDVYGCIYFGDHRALKLGDIERGMLEEEQVKQFIDQYRQIPQCNFESCNNSHCFECPAANFVHRGSMANRFSNTCHLLNIEKDIFNKYASNLPITKLDHDFYWFDQDHLGLKQYYEKLNEENNLPLTKEHTITSNTVKPSDTYTHVIKWMPLDATKNT